MKHLKTINQIIAIILVLFLISCSGSGNKTKQANTATSVQEKSEPVKINPEAQMLLKYLEETGDYVNSRNFPSLIKASSVNEELAGNIKIIDLRNSGAFSKGHIKGAVNIDFSQIPNYFTNVIKPFEFNKIVMVCYDGQISSYATSLLRLMGYGNVYALRWGMSSWNKEFAKDSWFYNVSSKYEDKLELTENERAVSADLPLMNTGKLTGAEIMAERFKILFAAGSSDIFITADEIFEQPQNYYTINYDRKDKYDSGHIPGAVRYKPNGTLGIISEMETIPADKNVIVYCGTGHNSGFATAYLRLFCYNAKTLIYGNNAFMHDKMVTDKTKLSWLPFTDAEVGDFPYVKN
ncbi:MAG: rhodanese-like domain-containing protein [Bacteroidota bacterium]|nr:rhodanese-like domain-containing protein [Bacteroidota bacterium]